MGKRVSSRAAKEHYWYKAFLLGLFFSAAFFIPYIVLGKGYFLYYGDFNVQQVPFYQMIHDALRRGEFRWSTTTDLGSSVIGSYTFYILGSPFFWLTLPFPSEFVPYMMGPLLILKFGTASLTGYIYLRKYVRDKNNAVLGGLLYAFSGFSVYNIFFNHFHEAIVFFPLLLAAIDEYMETKRRGVVALAVFFCCCVNYYFFVGMVAFVIIYWVLKLSMHCWKVKVKDIFPLAFEVIVGFLATAVILIPTVLFVVQNPRVSDPPEGFGALLYGSEQRYLHIITSMFFPPDIPARPNFTPDSNSKWSSVAAWLPLFGMTGVIGYLQSRSKGWLKKLLPFLFLCTMVPILNSMFQMFVMSYYARWFYMLTLMMSLATIMAIENSRTDWKRAIRLSTAITLGIAIGIGFMPNGKVEDDLEFYETFGLERYPERFWIYTAIAVVSLALTALLIAQLKKNRKTFFVKATACFGVIAVIYSGYIVGLGRSHSYDIKGFIIPYLLNNGKDVDLGDDLQNVRSDFYETTDNVGMLWQIPSIQTFHSVVPGSLYDFYPTVGVTRDVASRPEAKYYGLRSFLSVKYLFDDISDTDEFKNEENQTRMPGYKYIATQNGFDVYLNNNYIPYGFYFENYITEDQYYECSEDKRHLLLLKAMVLTDEQEEKYAVLMNHIEDVNSLVYTPRAFSRDCTVLKDNTCSEFEYGNASFDAAITVPDGSDKLVFFSVPYEDGWSATVNGSPADIEKVDIGFMAVRVKGGSTNKIEFKYKTPGLLEGAVVSACSVILYVLYIVISAKKNKLKPKPRFRKSYHVSAFGSADELGEKYRNLYLGRNPMKRFSDSRILAFGENNGAAMTSQTTAEIQLPEESKPQADQTTAEIQLPEESNSQAEQITAEIQLPEESKPQADQTTAEIQLPEESNPQAGQTTAEIQLPKLEKSTEATTGDSDGQQETTD